LAAAGNLARRGVLVRELQGLEALSSVDTVIFDKTGTLTRDGQRIERTQVASGVRPEQALAWAASLATHSLHPLSRALVAAHEAQAKGASSGPALNGAVIERVGQGLEMQDAQGHMWRLGSWSFGHEWAPDIPVDAAQAQVHLVRKGQWLGSWTFSEDVREDARETVDRLRAAGVQVQILSGDRPQAVIHVAQQLGIDQAQGGCSPQDKLRVLQQAQQQGHKVAMVGDGLNDGPVLAGAHVSIALGQAVPLTQSNADLVLMGNRLLSVAEAFALSQKTLHVVRQNLWWAAFYNAVCVPLAWAGLLPPWLAGLGMALSSLLVVMNALRLSRS
jgi:Cu2+-exporting ATPase